MTKNQKITLGAALLAALVLGVVWIGPPDGPDTHPMSDLMGLPEVQAMFDSAGGWIALDLADSKYEAGTIIQLAPGAGIRPISHLRECYPVEVLVPVVGTLPSLTSQQSLAVDLSLLGAVQGVRLGPESRRARTVGLELDSVTSESLDPLRLAIWEEEGTNYDQVPAACRRYFSEPDIYVVSEAARVNRGTYSFYDEAGSRMEVNADRVGDFVGVEGNASASVTADGRLSITAPVTVAIRRAFRAEDGFEVLGAGAGEASLGDSLIRAAVAAPVP